MYGSNPGRGEDPSPEVPSKPTGSTVLMFPSPGRIDSFRFRLLRREGVLDAELTAVPGDMPPEHRRLLLRPGELPRRKEQGLSAFSTVIIDEASV